MTVHPNFNPPAGQVVDLSDPRLHWNGRAWTLRGKVVNVPVGHRLVGKSNGPYRSWSYDWQRRAWVDLSGPPPPAPPRPQPAPPRPQAPPPRPQPAPVRPQPAPARPAPQPQPQLKPAPKLVKEEVIVMESKKPHNVLEDLMKHPVAPVLGGLLMLAGYVTDEPAPPTIPDGLPEATAKQWQMIYAQNMQRFQRRMDIYRDLGMVLLGYAGSRSIVDVLDSRRALVEKKAG
jgi:hypothetical protein